MEKNNRIIIIITIIDNPLAGTSPKNPVQEIMVQGPQIKHVCTLLGNKGVPKRLIATDDKTSKKGKGKK